MVDIIPKIIHRIAGRGTLRGTVLEGHIWPEYKRVAAVKTLFQVKIDPVVLASG